MKKLTLVLALCVLAMAANALTVYYKNVTSWTKVCAYTFSEETLGKLPGAEMTAVAGHDGWYSIEVDETKSANIIFNNGGNGDQTGDLTIDAAQPYYNEAWTTGFDDEAVVDIYTVYYKNTAHWASVYAYAWGGAANTGSWPGKPMTAVADHADWYSIDFKGGLPANIIFNGGNGAPQTKDLTIDAGNLYYNNGWTNGFDGGVVVVIPEVCYLKHPFNGSDWEWQEMQKGTEGTFTLDAYWQGTGANVNTAMDDAGAKWFPAEQIIDCPAAAGMQVTYVYDAAASTLRIIAGDGPIVVEPADYYLVGYINGADYGDNEDYENLGEYKFVDGRLTATFTETSYVYVKTGDNKRWYMTAAYVEPAESATAVLSIANETVAEKVGVPGNVAVNFTLTDNGDGTLLLSYTTGGNAVDNLTAGYTFRIENGVLGITLEQASQIAVYTTEGQMIDTAYTAAYRCLLQSGVYIVRVGNTTEKVIVL